MTKSGSGTGYIILSKQEKEEALLKCPGAQLYLFEPS